jgi:hypothetical protein
MTAYQLLLRAMTRFRPFTTGWRGDCECRWACNHFSSIARTLNGWERGRGLSLGSTHAKILVRSSFSGGGASCGCVHSSLSTMIIVKHLYIFVPRQTLFCVLYTCESRWAGHLISRLPYSVTPVEGLRCRSSARSGGRIVASSASARNGGFPTARFFQAARY